MTGVVLDGRGGLALEELPAPPAPTGEAVVRVLLAGICSTDLELREGYMGFRGTPGHEFVGIIERAESAPSRVGERVVGEINAACLRCELCREGLPRHCASRTVLGILGRGGAMAERLALPLENLVPVPASLASERALFTEPVAAAYEVPAQVPVRGREVLVLGDGKLGGLVAQVLTLEGAEVTVEGRHEGKLALLAGLGIATRLAREGPAARRFPLVVDATGSPEGIERAMASVRPRGTIVLKSTCAAGKPLNLAPLVIDEVTVVGSRCGPFPPALRALAEGRLEPERTIDARFPLARAAEAFEVARTRGVRKVVLEVSRP